MPEDRKNEILHAFMKLSGRFGFDKTTMQDIAREAGVSVGVIYKDYANKEDLIDAYAEQIINKFIKGFQALIDKISSPEKQLHDLIIGSFKLIFDTVVNDLGIRQMLADESVLKYMHHMRRDFTRKDELDRFFINMIGEVMREGVAQGVFQIENIPETAMLFADAFKGYSVIIMFGESDFDQFLPRMEAMFQFLMKKIKV